MRDIPEIRGYWRDGEFTRVYKWILVSKDGMLTEELNLEYEKAPALDLSLIKAQPFKTPSRQNWIAKPQ